MTTLDADDGSGAREIANPTRVSAPGFDEAWDRGAWEEEGPLLELLLGAARHLHHTVDPALLATMLRRQPDSSPWARLGQAARTAGLRPEYRSLDLQGLRGALESGLPLVVFGSRQGMLLVGCRGTRLEWMDVSETRWVEPRTLREHLWPEGGDARSSTAEVFPCLLLDPVLPASVLSPAGNDHASPLARLWSLGRVESQDLGVVLLTSLTIGLLSLATPLVVQVLINTVALATLRQPIIVLAGLLFTCVALVGLLRVFQRGVVEVLQRRIFVRLVADLSARLPRVRLPALEAEYGPELVNRFFDVLTVQKSAKHLLLDGLAVVLQAAVGLLLLAFYHPALLAFSVLLVLALGLILLPGANATQLAAIQESKAKYAVAGWLEELARNPFSFRGGAGVAWALRRADALSQSWVLSREAHFRRFLRQYAGVVGLQAVAGAGLLAVGGLLVGEGQLSLGQLVASEFVLASVLSALTKFSEKLEVWYDLTAAIDKLGHLVELPLERGSGRAGPRPPGPAHVELQQLSFRFPRSSWGLGPLDLVLEPGERCLVAGGTASGKSTLASLLLGLRDPSAGRVLLDRADLRELQLESVRDQVHLLSAVEVIQASIADNITMDSSDPPEPAELRQILDRVGLRGAVAALPDGMDTHLSPVGAPLSSGRVRALMVARALAARPRLLIIDEVLDGLSTAEQARLVEALSPPERPWSLLVFSRHPDLPGPFDRRLRLAEGNWVDLAETER